MEFKGIRYEKKGPVATITKINPEFNYAMDKVIVPEVNCALQDAKVDDEIRVVVITSESGVHQGAFCVYQVMMEQPDNTTLGLRDLYVYGHEVARTIWTMDKPVIGVVKKEGCGGGMEFLHACDFVIGAEDAEFSAPEVESGAICSWGGSQRIPRMVGWRRAQEILMLGGRMTGREAADCGLITRAVPVDQVDAEVQKIIDRILSLPPQGIAYNKMALHKTWEMNLSAGLDWEIEAATMILAEGSFKKITDCYMTGEKPQFGPYYHTTHTPEWQ